MRLRNRDCSPRKTIVAVAGVAMTALILAYLLRQALEDNPGGAFSGASSLDPGEDDRSE